MLKSLYESGTAFYTFPGCPDFDIVASIRYKLKDSFQFAPLLISVKARVVFTPTDAAANCVTMEDKLTDALNATETCHRGLCIVMVIGAAAVSDDGDRSLKQEDIQNLFADKTVAENSGKMVMAKVLRIRNDDVFGITNAMLDATSDSQEMSEVFASHSFVKAHVYDSSELLGKKSSDLLVIESSELLVKKSSELLVKKSMRKKRSKTREACVFMKTLVTQLRLKVTQLRPKENDNDNDDSGKVCLSQSFIFISWLLF
jgi:hypothetical protein